MNLSKQFVFLICLLSISSALAQSKQLIAAADFQSLDRSEKELRVRFTLNEEREIDSAADIARQYLKRYPNGLYADYLGRWLRAFENAQREYPNSLYKRAEFMRRWREENSAARDNLTTEELKQKEVDKSGVILLTSVLADVETRMKKSQPIQPAQYVVPPPPRPAILAPVDCFDTENCFNANAYTLILEPVNSSAEKSIVARLENIERTSGLFGCYDIRVLVDEQINIRCRYVRRVEIGDKTKISEVITSPKSWSEQLKNEQISQVWLENGIRVDSEGFPLEQPLRTARPIAVRTNTTFYLVSERFDSNVSSQAGHVTSFKNKIFDISACPNAATCRDLVMSKYIQKVETRFAFAPLSVPVLGNSETPPGEVWLGKTKRRSDVLGLPWHEISRYVIKWYGRDADVTLFESGGGKGQPGRYIFLQIEQEYNVSPNINGTYRDATPAQEAKYKQRVDEVVRMALVDACMELGGTMVNEVKDNQARNVCVIPRR